MHKYVLSHTYIDTRTYVWDAYIHTYLWDVLADIGVSRLKRVSCAVSGRVRQSLVLYRQTVLNRQTVWVTVLHRQTCYLLASPVSLQQTRDVFVFVCVCPRLHQALLTCARRPLYVCVCVYIYIYIYIYICILEIASFQPIYISGGWVCACAFHTHMYSCTFTRSCMYICKVYQVLYADIHMTVYTRTQKLVRKRNTHARWHCFRTVIFRWRLRWWAYISTHVPI